MAEGTNNTAVAQPQENKNSYDELVAKLAKKLEENGQLILTGAPGTGKTYTAQKIAEKMLDGSLTSSNYKLVQFHPGYSYSDFVEGLKPEKCDSGITFERKPGVFMEFCNVAYCSVSLPGEDDFDNALSSFKEYLSTFDHHKDNPYTPDSETYSIYIEEEEIYVKKDGETQSFLDKENLRKSWNRICKMLNHFGKNGYRVDEK